MAGVDRGVSTVVGYVLNLGIATILIAGLLISGAALVSNQEERTVREELDVIGNRLAADLETADRLLRTANGSLTIRSTLPETVAGSSYDITVRDTGDGLVLDLVAQDPSINRTIPVRNVSPVQTGTIPGGDISIKGTNGELEVTDG